MTQGFSQLGVAVEELEIVTVASATLGEDDAYQFLLLIGTPTLEPGYQRNDRDPRGPGGFRRSACATRRLQADP